MSTAEPLMPNIADDDAGEAPGDAGIDQDRVEEEAGAPNPAPDGSTQDDPAFRTPVPGESLSPEELAEED